MSVERKRAAGAVLVTLLLTLAFVAAAPYSDWHFLAAPMAGLQAALLWVLATYRPVDASGRGALVELRLDGSQDPEMPRGELTPRKPP